MAEPEAPQKTGPGYEIHIGEEMDRAKWTLPPVKPVLIALMLVIIVVGAVAWFNRYQPPASASIDQVFAVERTIKAECWSRCRSRYTIPPAKHGSSTL